MNRTADKPWRKIGLVLGVLALLAVVLFLTAEINIYGVICRTHDFRATPNEAELHLNEARSAEAGIGADTPVYTWQADDYNAICCFVTAEGVLTDRMYTKNGGYHATGWGNYYPFVREEPDPEDEAYLYAAVRLIKAGGLYGDELRYTVLPLSDDPAGEIVLTFPVNGETWAIMTPRGE